MVVYACVASAIKSYLSPSIEGVRFFFNNKPFVDLDGPTRWCGPGLVLSRKWSFSKFLLMCFEFWPRSYHCSGTHRLGNKYPCLRLNSMIKHYYATLKKKQLAGKHIDETHDVRWSSSLFKTWPAAFASSSRDIRSEVLCACDGTGFAYHSNRNSTV